MVDVRRITIVCNQVPAWASGSVCSLLLCATKEAWAAAPADKSALLARVEASDAWRGKVITGTPAACPGVVKPPAGPVGSWPIAWYDHVFKALDLGIASDGSGQPPQQLSVIEVDASAGHLLEVFGRQLVHSESESADEAAAGPRLYWTGGVPLSCPARKRELVERCNKITEDLTENRLQQQGEDETSARGSVDLVVAKLPQTGEPTLPRELLEAVFSRQKNLPTPRLGPHQLLASVEDLAGPYAEAQPTRSALPSSSLSSSRGRRRCLASHSNVG